MSGNDERMMKQIPPDDDRALWDGKDCFYCRRGTIVFKDATGTPAFNTYITYRYECNNCGRGVTRLVRQ